MNCPRCGADDIRVMGETDGGKLFVVSDCGLAVMVTREELEAAVAQEDAESDD
jgi:Zn ribbon nucleic-acid-binding protein